MTNFNCKTKNRQRKLRAGPSNTNWGQGWDAGPGPGNTNTRFSMAYCRLMKYFKAMSRKTKIALLLEKSVMISYLILGYLLTKHTAKNTAKKTFLLASYFLTLIITVNFFLCYIMFLYGLL